MLVAGLIVVGALAVLSLARHWRRQLEVGVPIIYRVVEASNHPGPEAREIHPSAQGELYYYLTMKYWRVEQILEDGWIVALTPLMEHQYLRRDDPNLRRASLVERLRFAARFPGPA